MAAPKIHIERNTVQETLIIPLFARKICNEVYGDFFKDPKAQELMDRLDYDFGDVEKRSNSFVQRFGALEVAARQKGCAWEVKEYLKTHPNASVVNLGCGLDQTAESCDNGSCKIYNVDMPDIIEIRQQLIPAGDRVTCVSTDLNDQQWFRKIDRDQGAVFFGTGVFYYFTLEQMQKLVNGMAEYFPDGVLVFDIAGKTAVKAAVKAWIREAGIEGIFTSFYVGSLEKDVTPWLKKATATCRGYMTGYTDLKETSISGIQRLLAKFADRVMKMKIVRIQFDK